MSKANLRRRVLTMGSVHLDTIATRPPGERFGQGPIIHAIGGSMYNVAANLSRHSKLPGKPLKTRVYTILPKYSYLTQVFARKIKESGIDASCVLPREEFGGVDVKGGGFVAVFDPKENKIQFAVIDAAIHSVHIFADRKEKRIAERALKWAGAVVIDGDLSISTILHISDFCKDRTLPLFVCVGSYDAAKVYWLGSQNRAFAVCAHAEILDRILKEAGILASAQLFAQGETIDRGDIKKVCDALKTRHLILVHFDDPRGYLVLSSDGDVQGQVFVPATDAVKKQVVAGNTAGIADACMAAFLETYFQYRSADDPVGGPVLDLTGASVRNAFSDAVVRFTSTVIEQQGATTDSEITHALEGVSNVEMVWRTVRMVGDAVRMYFGSF